MWKVLFIFVVLFAGFMQNTMAAQQHSLGSISVIDPIQTSTIASFEFDGSASGKCCFETQLQKDFSSLTDIQAFIKLIIVDGCPCTSKYAICDYNKSPQAFMIVEPRPPNA